MTAKYIPEGYHTATPHLVVPNADEAIRFYQAAFGAQEVTRLEHGGTVGYAQIRIGDSAIMLTDEVPGWGKSPKTLGGTPVGIALYVEDCDRVFAQAVQAGGQIVLPVQDQFYGDRSGVLTDPSGHKWTVATHQEDVPPEEMERRFHAFMEQMTHKSEA